MADFSFYMRPLRLLAETLLIQLQPRKIALFGYETQRGSASILWTDPGVFSLNENETYLKWSGTKRSLTEEEIVDHTWVKVADHGDSFIVRFMADGELFESFLSDPDREWQGSWMLIDGMLRTTINHNGIHELDILAYRDGSMYSGVESQNGMKAASAYFILLPSRKPNTKQEEGKAVRDTKPYDDALDGYDQIIHFNPRCGRAYRAKGDILRDLERYEEALAAYEQSIEVRPSMRRWYSKGDVLYKLHRYEEALAAFEEAIQLDGKNAKAWHGKGQTLRELQRYEEALAAFGQALSINPKLARSYNEKGNVLFRNLKRFEEALAAYQQATKLDSDYMWAWHNMGNVLETLERFEEALTAYQRAAQLDLNYMWAWHNTGNMLHKFHRYEEALEAYKRATEIDPHYMWAWYNTGDVLHELGRHEEALGAFYQAIDCDDHVAVIWREKGKTLQDLKRYEEALASYERALELESHYASIWTKKGEVLRALKRYEEALTVYDKALQLESNDVDAYLGKGRVYLDLGRYNDALDVYEQATNVASNNTWAWHDKGVAFGHLQRAEEALEAFERAIELDPENKWAWFHKAETLAYLARQAYKKAGQPGREPLKREYYNLVQKATGKCLDGDGSRVYIGAPNGGDFQLWKAAEVSPNTIVLWHFQSGKVLEATKERGMYFNEYTTSPAQQWRLEDADEGYKKLSHVATELLLHGGDTDNDVKLQPALPQPDGGDFQIWRAVKIHITSFIAPHDSSNAAELLVFEQ